MNTDASSSNDIEKQFWEAIQNGNNDTVAELLEQDSSLAGKNFDPESLHTNGFPLYHAAEQGNRPMVIALLKAGADPDAKLDTDDPREVGMPLMNALARGHLEIVNLILDYEPTLNAHPYCATPFVDCLFNKLWDTERSYELGEPWKYNGDCGSEISGLFRYSFSNYLPSSTGLDIDSDREASPELHLLRRVIEMGGQPSLFTVVRHEQHDLIEQLLRKCASKKGTLMDWPQGTVFQNIKGAATWCGYPKTVEVCMGFCPTLYTNDVARHSVENAIRSHNRDGGIDQYFELIDLQLRFLKDKNGLADCYENGNPFLPLHWLADDFIEPSHYGFKCGPLSTEADLIRLAQMFLDYGFDINAEYAETKETPLQVAQKNNLPTVAEFLVKNGANDTRS